MSSNNHSTVRTETVAGLVDAQRLCLQILAAHLNTVGYCEFSIRFFVSNGKWLTILVS